MHGHSGKLLNVIVYPSFSVDELVSPELPFGSCGCRGTTQQNYERIRSRLVGASRTECLSMSAVDGGKTIAKILAP